MHPTSIYYNILSNNKYTSLSDQNHQIVSIDFVDNKIVLVTQMDWQGMYFSFLLQEIVLFLFNFYP